MKLIVIDLDRLHWMPLTMRIRLNASKICTLIKRDFGKKTLLKLPKNDPRSLIAKMEYEDAIFKLKDEGRELSLEGAMFRKLIPKVEWFRVGIILRREKAVKILGRLLGIS